MPNIAQALKQEIARIARKELRSGTDSLKKSASRHRSELAALKRRLNQLERQLRSSKRTTKETPAAQSDGPSGLRFRAAGLASHRKRLGLSAREAGQLLGVSQLTVYHWEKGETRPRASQMKSIDAFRKLGRREALARLSST